MNHVDILGWVGTILSLIFYLLLAIKKVRMAYILLAISALVWAVVAVEANLSSLLAKEIIVGLFILLGWHNWRKDKHP